MLTDAVGLIGVCSYQDTWGYYVRLLIFKRSNSGFVAFLPLPAPQPQPCSTPILYIILTSSVIPTSRQQRGHILNHPVFCLERCCDANRIFIYLEIYYFILAPCMGAGILNGFSFGLGVNVNHQELARVDRKGVCVFVCVRAHGVRHCFSLAAICKVNVVENNIHLPTHPSQNSFISRSTLTRLLIVLSNVTCIILSVSDTINKVFKSLLLPSYLSSVHIWKHRLKLALYVPSGCLPFIPA